MARRITKAEAVRRGWLPPCGNGACEKQRNIRAGTPQALLYKDLQSAGIAVEWERKGLVAHRRFVVDLYLPEARVVVEFDGYRYHRSKAAFQKDRERQNALVLAGYRVLRYFAAQVLDEKRRATVVEEVVGFVRGF